MADSVQRGLNADIATSPSEFNLILDRFEKGQPFYLYTGRGPSSDSMHLGHMIPFVFTQWLQDVFDCPLVVQLTGEQWWSQLRFLVCSRFIVLQTTRNSCSSLSSNSSNATSLRSRMLEMLLLAVSNPRRPSFSLIWTLSGALTAGESFSSTQKLIALCVNSGAFYRNVVQISRLITARQSQQTFGFKLEDNVGKWSFVSIQAAPSFSNSFPQIFGTKSDVPCLIPCAIDQDPYFRLTREVAPRLKYKKPALIHAKFIPSLLGAQSKMSASVDSTSIFMTDTAKQIKDKINKYAFSGGQTSIEEHREKGGDPDVDVSFQYLTFFLEDDDQLAQIAADYRSGKLLTGELKAMTIKLLQDFVKGFQEVSGRSVSCTRDGLLTLCCSP